MAAGEENGPLVAFTALAPLAVGGLVGLLATRVAPGPGLDWPAVSLLAVALLALAASSLHLARPLGAYRALRRLSTSWLSREVVFFAAFVLLLAAYALPLSGPSDQHQPALGVLASIAGGMSLVATAAVYRLPSRPAWHRWTTSASLLLSALGAGLLLGRFVVRFETLGDASPNSALTVAAAAALLLGAAVSGLRIRRPDPVRAEEFATWELVVGPCRPLLVLRIAGALCGVAFLLAPAWLSVVAWVPAFVGELADRLLFFRSVVPVSAARRAGALPFIPVPIEPPLP